MTTTDFHGFILAGSILSVLGSAFIIICHTCLGVRDSVRAKLIVCLALADLGNSVNNAISGVVIALGRPIADLPCLINGFIGQWTVVAQDVSILVIAVATVLALRKPLEWYTKSSFIQQHITIVIASIWLYALGTSVFALFAAGYGRQDGDSFCWIKEKPEYVRFVATHFLRYGVIIAIIVAYSYIYFELRKATAMRSKTFAATTVQEAPTKTASTTTPPVPQLPGSHAAKTPAFPAPTRGRAGSNAASNFSPSASLTTVRTNSTKSQREKTDPVLKIMRLMVVFPLVYIVLWLPGLINRLYFALSGSQNDVLNLLQGLSQWIGLANALLYGMNKEITGKLNGTFTRWRNLRSNSVTASKDTSEAQKFFALRRAS